MKSGEALHRENRREGRGVRPPGPRHQPGLCKTPRVTNGQAEDAERLAKWRSWVHPDAKPEGWDSNLWDEFYGLLHRRDMWNGYRDALEASPKDAREPARYLTQWVLRNHIETQALAIRRIADRSTHHDTIALGRLLDEIAGAAHILGVQATDATADAKELEEIATRVRTFANKVVAHLDADHAAASRGVNFADLDASIVVAARVWERWFLAVTGEGVVVDLPPIGWSNVIRLHRRDVRIESPGLLGARVHYSLGEDAARELLDVLKRTPEDRTALIGRLYGQSESRWLAESLMDIEADPDDLIRLRLIAELERMFGS
jgi:AbiU2